MSYENFAPLKISNAKFIFRTNFRGLDGPYNNEGEPCFNVILEGDILEQALNYGMNVKTISRKGYDPISYIKVNVGCNDHAPHAELIYLNTKKILTEQMLYLLDIFEYENVDVVIRPNHYRCPDGSTGVNAYLQSIYATLIEDQFANNYYDILIRDDTDKSDALRIAINSVYGSKSVFSTEV